MDGKIKEYLKGKLNESGQKELLEWLRSPENLMHFNRLKSEWIGANEFEELSDEYHEGLVHFQGQLLESSHKKRLKSIHNYRILSYAAIFLLLFSVPFGIINYKKLHFYSEKTWSTMVVDGGQVSKMVLPDSSVVWVNSMSKLSYDNMYGKKNREIHLEGQAFFHVSKKKGLPFIVNSQNLNVEATGTMFDVEAYSSMQYTKIILLEGAINVWFDDNTQQASLKPGELLSYNNHSRDIIVSRVNAQRLVSWKEGLLTVYDMPLKETIEKLQHRYNCKFIIDKKIEDVRVTISLKNEDLSGTLEIIRGIIPVSILNKNDTIYIHSRK